MSREFHEMLDLAVNLEKEGAEFYEKLSLLAKNKTTRDIFRSFASDELKHIKTFTELKESEQSGKEVPYDSSLKELVDEISHEEVLPLVNEGDIENIHPLTAIKLGIKTEKNTVKFYKHILKRIKTEEGKRTLEELIKEEKRHAANLTEMHKNKTFDF